MKTPQSIFDDEEEITDLGKYEGLTSLYHSSQAAFFIRTWENGCFRKRFQKNDCWKTLRRREPQHQGISTMPELIVFLVTNRRITIKEAMRYFIEGWGGGACGLMEAFSNALDKAGIEPLKK